MHDARRSVADQVVEEKQRIAAEARGPLSTGRWAWEWIRSFLIAFGLFLFIRTFFVEAFRIPTGSMENTLLVGDFLLVNKTVYGARVPFTTVRTPVLAEPERGDIIVFTPPHEPDRNYVKRLVGVPGDTIEMNDRQLIVNGHPVVEPYARYSSAGDVYAPDMFWQCEHAPADAAGDPCHPTRDDWGPVVVPAAGYFVLGDNRDNSEDSRYWGFVDRASIKGTPLIIYYSYDPIAGSPAPWLTGIRWSRIGDRVN